MSNVSLIIGFLIIMIYYLNLFKLLTTTVLYFISAILISSSDILIPLEAVIFGVASMYVLTGIIIFCLNIGFYYVLYKFKILSLSVFSFGCLFILQLQLIFQIVVFNSAYHLNYNFMYACFVLTFLNNMSIINYYKKLFLSKLYINYQNLLRNSLKYTFIAIISVKNTAFSIKKNLILNVLLKFKQVVYC